MDRETTRSFPSHCYLCHPTLAFYFPRSLRHEWPNGLTVTISVLAARGPTGTPLLRIDTTPSPTGEAANVFSARIGVHPPNWGDCRVVASTAIKGLCVGPIKWRGYGISFRALRPGLPTGAAATASSAGAPS